LNPKVCILDDIFWQEDIVHNFSTVENLGWASALPHHLPPCHDVGANELNRNSFESNQICCQPNHPPLLFCCIYTLCCVVMLPMGVTALLQFDWYWKAVCGMQILSLCWLTIRQNSVVVLYVFVARAMPAHLTITLVTNDAVLQSISTGKPCDHCLSFAYHIVSLCHFRVVPLASAWLCTVVSWM